jgi:hypothetical protein
MGKEFVFPNMGASDPSSFIKTPRGVRNCAEDSKKKFPLLLDSFNRCLSKKGSCSSRYSAKL